MSGTRSSKENVALKVIFSCANVFMAKVIKILMKTVSV